MNRPAPINRVSESATWAVSNALPILKRNGPGTEVQRGSVDDRYQVEAGRTKGWLKRPENAIPTNESQYDRENQNAQIWREITVERYDDALGTKTGRQVRKKVRQEWAQNVSQHHAHESPGQRNQNTLSEELANNSGSRSANGNSGQQLLFAALFLAPAKVRQCSYK